MIYNFVLGIVFSVLSALFVILSTFSKKKKTMIKVQTIDQIFGALANFCLYSYSALVINIVNILRNFLTYKEKFTKPIACLFILFYIGFGLWFNTQGWIGVFPIIASSSYAYFCLKSKNVQFLRYGLVLNQILWFVHDIYIKAYPTAIVAVLVSTISIYNIVKYNKEKNLKKIRN